MNQDFPTRLQCHSNTDVVMVRQAVRSWAQRVGLNLVSQTKMVTAASELARNMVTYAGGGVVEFSETRRGDQKGLRLVFSDEGPGIADPEQALEDGFSTGAGLGLGLGGARRLVDVFDIDSEPGRGTTVSVVRWR